MTNERLDETIDRVAAELTAASPDAAFTGRLQSRLDAPASSFPLGFAVPAAVALVAVVGISTALRLTEPAVRHEAGAVLAPLVATPTIAVAAATYAGAAPRLAPQRAPSHLGPVTVEPSDSARVESTTPQKLLVEALSFDSLTVATVQLRVLDLRDLEVPGVEAGGQPKEQ